MRLGLVGPGRMGRPMAHRLAEAGHEVRVLGRSAATRTSLAEDGLTAVGEIAEVAAGADAVLVCVYTDDQVREVCLDGGLLAAMPAGSVVIVHTTGSPRTAEAIAERAASHGIDVLDSPLSGGPHDVAASTVTLYVGGASDTVTRLRPVLDCYGDPVVHAGPLGAGQRVKLVNNALFTAHIGLLSEAVRLGAQLGIDEGTLLTSLPHGSAASRAATFAAAKGSVAAVAASVGEFVGKDVAVVRKVAAELGGDLGALDTVIDVMADQHRSHQDRRSP